MRISRMSIAILILFYIAIAYVQGQDTGKSAPDSLSETEDKYNAIHIEKDTPNPF